MLFEFILFAILGWCVFVEAPPRMVLMIIFVVLMVLWLVVGVTGFDVGGHLRLPR